MTRIGQYNVLKVMKEVPFGVYLDDGQAGILLPKRFVPKGTKTGDELNVFLYHDGEGRVIATTERPKGIVGDIVYLRAVGVTPHGAFLDFGLMKDLFVPKSKQIGKMQPQGDYLVKIYLDEKTGRLAATEKIDAFLSNERLTVKEKEVVDLTVYRRTDIGYLMIINNRHTGVLHFNEVYRDIQIGDQFRGFIKQILPGDKVDVAAGTPGYGRVEEETGKILRLLHEHNGYLPYYDKSSPGDIYAFFSMSKKTFKMATGHLYKQRKIEFTEKGIRSIPEGE